MNEGELLYQGEPTALTQTMAGRSFLMTSPHEGNCKLLQRALKLLQVSDGMIQGEIGTSDPQKETTPDDIRHADGMPEININETTPRFEDAFIDRWAVPEPRNRRWAQYCIRWKVHLARR